MRFGVDEAGKGPAVGSMFAAAVAVPGSDVLPEDVGDSKGVDPDRRESMAASLRADERVAIGVAEIPPSLIDDPETDMNTLTVRAHALAIRDMRDPDSGGTADPGASTTEGHRDRDAATTADPDPPATGAPDATVLETGVLDAGDVDADRFARRVADRLSWDPEPDLVAEHGADETDPVVGAASVVAKVRRDAHVEALSAEYGDVGSGYPGDPTTREFLRSYLADHGELPPCARSSWRTCRDIVAEREQSGLDEF